MTKAYFFMFIAIFCEVCGTLLLPSTQNFTKIIPTAIAATCYLSALYCLTHVLHKIPIAIVYATWSGLGIFTIGIFGYFFCLLYTSPSPRDGLLSRMPSSA